jgi:multisubunit Na+/H+ antiporter MnhB subunit
MWLPALLIVVALLIIAFGFNRVLRAPRHTGNPERLSGFVVMLAFAFLAVIAMATQYARIRAGQMPLTTQSAPRR